MEWESNGTKGLVIDFSTKTNEKQIPDTKQVENNVEKLKSENFVTSSTGYALPRENSNSENESLVQNMYSSYYKLKKGKELDVKLDFSSSSYSDTYNVMNCIYTLLMENEVEQQSKANFQIDLYRKDAELDRFDVKVAALKDELEKEKVQKKEKEQYYRSIEKMLNAEIHTLKEKCKFQEKQYHKLSHSEVLCKTKLRKLEKEMDRLKNRYTMVLNKPKVNASRGIELKECLPKMDEQQKGSKIELVEMAKTALEDKNEMLRMENESLLDKWSMMSKKIECVMDKANSVLKPWQQPKVADTYKKLNFKAMGVADVQDISISVLKDALDEIQNKIQNYASEMEGKDQRQYECRLLEANAIIEHQNNLLEKVIQNNGPLDLSIVNEPHMEQKDTNRNAAFLLSPIHHDTERKISMQSIQNPIPSK